MSEEKSRKGKLQRLIEFVKAFATFLGRRYVWSGLLGGFLWTFPAPFILYAISLNHWSLSQELIWALFFPITATYYMLNWGAGPEGYVDALLLWMLSVVLGMIIGATVTYCIHRVRILMKR